jgi:hypothetical protein
VAHCTEHPEAGNELSICATESKTYFELGWSCPALRIRATIPPGDEFLQVFVDDETREVAVALHSDFIEKSKKPSILFVSNPDYCHEYPRSQN